MAVNVCQEIMWKRKQNTTDLAVQYNHRFIVASGFNRGVDIFASRLVPGTYFDKKSSKEGRLVLGEKR